MTTRTIIIRLDIEAKTDADFESFEDAVENALDYGTVQDAITEARAALLPEIEEDDEGEDEEDEEDDEEEEDETRIASAIAHRDVPSEQMIAVIMSRNYWATDELLRALGCSD